MTARKSEEETMRYAMLRVEIARGQMGSTRSASNKDLIELAGKAWSREYDHGLWLAAYARAWGAAEAVEQVQRFTAAL